LLTADLVRARRRGDALTVTPLDAAGRATALELAATLLALTEAHVGKTRGELDEVMDAVIGGARDRKLAAGLAKLIWDRAELAEAVTIDPEALRHDVFTRARDAWTRAGEGGRFDRAAVLAAVAADHGLTAGDIERGLYADLREAHVVTRPAAITAPRLVEAYELAQPQAVLLRAVRVVVEVESAIPGAYRTLFRKLKFLRLLCAITPRARRGYRIEIDGPFSLFESSTRYGLALALALPAIRELDKWSLVADLRWGAARTPLVCRLDGRGEPDAEAPPHLADEVRALLEDLRAQGTPWQAAPATDLLDLPGHGVCVPDLTFTHARTGERVHLEVLGYWSRDAVWKRVELIQAGLAHRIVFAVGQHLRVSEAALDAELPGALYVYKRTMSAKAILERVEALAAVPVPRPRKAGKPGQASKAGKAGEPGL
jgi:predicted nuclease of restriction endonuclease-like RecB superfamily